MVSPALVVGCRNPFTVKFPLFLKELTGSVRGGLSGGKIIIASSAYGDSGPGDLEEPALEGGRGGGVYMAWLLVFGDFRDDPEL